MTTKCQWQGIGYLGLMSGGMVSSPISVEKGRGKRVPYHVTSPGQPGYPTAMDRHFPVKTLPSQTSFAVMLKRKQNCAL